MKKLLLALVLISSFIAVEAVTAQPCLSYDPAIVKLRGVIKERKAPNVNENESAAPNGKWDHFLVVHLAKPVCVDADSDAVKGEGNNGAESGIREIELVNLFPGKKFYSEYARWKQFAHNQKSVIVTGKLYHEDNGNQHTEVLVEVLSVEESH